MSDYLYIDITDKLTPFLSKNKAGKLYKAKFKVALRMTAAHFRKSLKLDTGYKYGNAPSKRLLDGEGERRFLAHLPSLMAKGYNARALRRKHLSRNKHPWRGSIRNTITYKTLDEDGMSYAYGFTGKTKSGGESKTAIRFGKALQEGMFIDPKSKKLSKTITPQMHEYFEAIGLTTTKNQLNFPSREVIAPFFQNNKSNMFKYLANKYEYMVKEIQRKADSQKPDVARIKVG